MNECKLPTCNNKVKTSGLSYCCDECKAIGWRLFIKTNADALYGEGWDEPKKCAREGCEEMRYYDPSKPPSYFMRADFHSTACHKSIEGGYISKPKVGSKKVVAVAPRKTFLEYIAASSIVNQRMQQTLNAPVMGILEF